jgi:hypothetical protein
MLALEGVKLILKAVHPVKKVGLVCVYLFQGPDCKPADYENQADNRRLH